MSESNNKTKTIPTQAQQLKAADKTKKASSQGKQVSKEQPILKKATMKMMRKVCLGQQSRKCQLNNKSSSSKTKINRKKYNQRSQVFQTDSLKDQRMSFRFKINLKL